MKHFRTFRRRQHRWLARAVGAVMATMLLATGPLSAQTQAQTQPAPLPDKPFAEHRIVLQLDLARVFDSLSTGLGVPPTYVSIRIGL